MQSSNTSVPDIEEMDALLQEMELEELHGFAHIFEDDPSGSEGQTELLSSVYFFIFSKTNEITYLHKAIRTANDAVAATSVGHPERAAKLDNIGIRLAGNRASLPNAAHLGLTEIVKLLLEKGADVNVEDGDGGTALHRAACMGHEAVARQLLENGADVNARRKDNVWTPLREAAGSGHEAVVRLLLENGADVSAKGKDNFLPLHHAAGEGHEAVVRLLVENGADIDAEDSDGDTALHSAAFKGHEAVARLLLEKGANVNANTRRTALQWAAQQGHDAVVQLLLEKGASADVIDDSHIPLGTVSKGRLLQDIEDAQKIMFHESLIQPWAQNLRLVVPAAKSEGSSYDFELIETDLAEAESEPYIAISYCWGHNLNMEAPLRMLVPSRKQPGTKEIRHVRARPDILHRSLLFAAAKGVRRIWVDQECIHQDDEVDKQKAIQSMHLVYRHAAITLIVMDYHVQTLSDVDALPDIRKHGVHNELRGRIIRDKWFTRSWTTQEYSASSSENLTYLVGWKDDVDVSGDAWERAATAFNESGGHPRQNVRRAWELNHSQIFDIAHMCPDYHLVTSTLSGNVLFGSLGSELIFTLINENIEAMYWWKSGLK
jgi:ankyrin repeat protein